MFQPTKNAVNCESTPELQAPPTDLTANTSTAVHVPRQWLMVNIIPANHGRFLSNLSLNRELDRLASFARWPAGRPNVSPTSLAKTGFFYLGDMDCTQCFSCGGVLHNWTVNDGAFAEHRSHFPQCKMVLGTENRNVPVPVRPKPVEERERNFPCRFPSNPHMRSEAMRLCSFDTLWPSGRMSATPSEIAQAGFFFLGESDRVKCWYCNGGLQNWDYDDIPWVEHAKWFPNCQFLLRVKGQRFVHQHLSANAHLHRPSISKQDGAYIDPPSYGFERAFTPASSRDVLPADPSENQPSTTPVIIDPREEQRVHEQYIQSIMRNSDIVKETIVVFGFDCEIVEAVLEEKLAPGNVASLDDIYSSLGDLLDDVMKKEQEMKDHEEELRMSQAVALAILTEQNPFTTATSTVEEPPSTMDTETTLQEALRKLEKESLCKMCSSNKADMVFIPCSHMCCCMECTQAIRQCPLCRKPIEKAIKTYVA